MKDKRNCNNNMNYPVYQQPMMIPPMGYPINYPNVGNYSNIQQNPYDQQLNNIEQKINVLEQRITRLENLNSNNYSKYNDSNYYMV